jgi:hypothetical protein
MANTNRILVRLRSSVALTAAAPRANLRLLFEPAAPSGVLGVAAAPAWYIADIPDGGPTPWDGSHARVADQLGVAGLDVLFAEPDLPQSYATANERSCTDQPFADIGGF